MAKFIKTLTVATTSAAVLASSLSFAFAAPPVPSDLKAKELTSIVTVQSSQYYRRPGPPPPAPVVRKKRNNDAGAIIAGAAVLGILGAAAIAANNDRPRPQGYRPPPPPQPGYGYYQQPGYGYAQPAYGYDPGGSREAMRAASQICKDGSKRHYRREYGADSWNEQITQAAYRGGGSWEMQGSATVTGPYGRQQVGFLCVTSGKRIIQFQ